MKKKTDIHRPRSHSNRVLVDPFVLVRKIKINIARHRILVATSIITDSISEAAYLVGLPAARWLLIITLSDVGRVIKVTGIDLVGEMNDQARMMNRRHRDRVRLPPQDLASVELSMRGGGSESLSAAPPRPFPNLTSQRNTSWVRHSRLWASH